MIDKWEAKVLDHQVTDDFQLEAGYWWEADEVTTDTTFTGANTWTPLLGGVTLYSLTDPVESVARPTSVLTAPVAALKRLYEAHVIITIKGWQGDVIEMQARKWDEEAQVYQVLHTDSKQIVKLPGDDIATFHFFAAERAQEMDRFELWVQNTSSNKAITMLPPSTVRLRPV